MMKSLASGLTGFPGIRCWRWAAVLGVLASAESTFAQSGWPEFRGPYGNGHVEGTADETALPLHWSETENVVWKTAIPYRGWSTPVILGSDVWVTTATEDGHEFFAIAVNAVTGQIRINKKIFHCDTPEPLGNAVNCYASPTAVAELGRVYVHFGSYGTACLDAANGDILWQRQDLPCRHYRGPGSSPILFENLLVLTFDGVDVDYVAALDRLSGETVWKTDRTTVWNDLDEQGKPKREGDMRKAYSTPFVIESAGKTQMLSIGSSCAFSYDPRTGAEFWKANLVGYTPATRPVFGDGLAFITSGRGKAELLAMRVDGEGDVTDSQVAWKFEGSDVPQEPSPILVDGMLYIVSNSGTATCLEAKSGTVIWSERIGGNYVTSPIHAGGRLYFCSTQGKTVVLRVGRAFEVLAENFLDEGFMASPAAVGKALFLRSKTHLYRIEDTAIPAQ